MTHTRFALPGAVLAALVLLALGGCAAPGSALELGGDEWELCASVPVGESMVLGETTRTGSADARVTIESVDVGEAVGLELTDAVVMPIVDGVPVMSMRPDEPSPSWGERRPAVGETIGSESTNVLVVLTRTGDGVATAGPLRITYRTSAGTVMTQQASTTYALRDDCEADANP